MHHINHSVYSEHPCPRLRRSCLKSQPIIIITRIIVVFGSCPAYPCLIPFRESHQPKPTWMDRMNRIKTTTPPNPAVPAHQSCLSKPFSHSLNMFRQVAAVYLNFSKLSCHPAATHVLACFIWMFVPFLLVFRISSCLSCISMFPVSILDGLSLPTATNMDGQDTQDIIHRSPEDSHVHGSIISVFPILYPTAGTCLLIQYGPCRALPDLPACTAFSLAFILPILLIHVPRFSVFPTL